MSLLLGRLCHGRSLMCLRQARRLGGEAQPSGRRAIYRLRGLAVVVLLWVLGAVATADVHAAPVAEAGSPAAAAPPGGVHAAPMRGLAERRPAPVPSIREASPDARPVVAGSGEPVVVTPSVAGEARTAGGIALPVVLSAGRITVRAEAGLDRRAAAIARRAPEALARIAADLAGLSTPQRVEIRVVKAASDLGRAAPPGRGAPAWAAGVAYPDMGVVVVATRRGADTLDIDRTVVHELAHLALGAALGERAPRWLHEGFSYLHSSDWSLARAQTLAGMAWTGDVTPLWALDARFPAYEAEVDRAYAQSYDVVAFMARRGRYRDPKDDGDRTALRQFLAALAAGDSTDEASVHAYGVALDDLFDEWLADLKRRYMLLPIGLVGGLVWVLAAILLVLAALRRRRQNRVRLAQWEIEEAGRGAPPAMIPLAQVPPWVASGEAAEPPAPQAGDGAAGAESGSAMRSGLAGAGGSLAGEAEDQDRTGSTNA